MAGWQRAAGWLVVQSRADGISGLIANRFLLCWAWALYRGLHGSGQREVRQMEEQPRRDHEAKLKTNTEYVRYRHGRREVKGIEEQPRRDLKAEGRLTQSI